ncbi:bifunctional oligoribonuclease/PAP phosphatase NrnA [bacterium]|nr:bifunctional oligoribonuclease/PAP phosphatase NrnA [bacterium]
MKTNCKPEQIREFIQADGEILVVTHFSPDGDAVGSLLAFGGILDFYGVEHILAIDDDVPEKYGFLPGFEKISNLRKYPLDRVFKRVVILDAGSLQRIGSAQSCIGQETTILNIDHHFTGAKYGNLNMVNVSAAATAEILYDLCLKLKIKFSQQIAYGLYVGILTDTGRFRFSNTTHKALTICGSLVKKGVKPGVVAENVYYNLPFDIIQALARVLLTLELHFSGLVCIIRLDRGNMVSDTEGFVEYGSSIRGVVLAVFISEIDHQVFKVSLRSRCDVDVSEVARKFGGGGHLKAAGFRFRGKRSDLTENLLDEFLHQIEIHKIKPGATYIQSSLDERNQYDELMLE